MRKTILSIYLFSIALIATAQLTSNSGKFYTSFSGIDYVFVFNGITPSTEITYTGTGTSINWYKFTDPAISISNQSYISPDDATGYILNVDGKVTHIWVIDYKNNLPVFKTIEPENNSASQCNEVKLLIDAMVPQLTYKSVDGNPHILIRDFSIKYKTLTWDDKTTSWKQIDTIQTLILPATQKSVPAPFCNTSFTLSGDQFATDLGLAPISISSSDYTPVAVICHATSIVTIRDAKNEAERPTQAAQVSGSAPLDMQFLSNANEPITQYYNWGIYQDNKLVINRTDKDHRYTFTQAGTYKVKVTVSNSTCSFSDSITVTVSESDIWVPNVFTPNGDGFNDEFRVAYKSLISFQCWVYNRWGRLVYTWTDPTKGWNGKINGKDAVPGPYFYVIKALGSDFDPNSKPNPITKERTGEKLRKGDINLLRGVGN